MQVQDINDYVRTSLDSDSTELPDALLATWFEAAEYRIYEALQDSRYFQEAETLTTTGTNATVVPAVIDSVVTIIGPFWLLRPIPYEDALARYPLNRDVTSPVTFGEPLWWSSDPNTDGGKNSNRIWLWPCPPSAEKLFLRGTRAFVPTAGVLTATPDFPPEIQPLIGRYMEALGYEFQQNAQIASMKMARFEGELDIAQRKWNRVSEAATTTIGGQRSRYNPPTPGGRLRYPFDF